MKILHYTLGLPPYRSGGLTKYSLDLMRSQLYQGDDVALLYPGDYTFWSSKRSGIKIKSNNYGFKCFEIINPTLVPLFYGVQSPNEILKHTELKTSILEDFYKHFEPQIFHIHTLMGLPIELLDFLKAKGVKLIFTSHDYYGLCPKVNFINQKQEVCNKASGFNCMQCNANASGTMFLKLRNSSYIMRYKSIINFIAKFKVQSVSNNTKVYKAIHSNEKEREYTDLLLYYNRIFSRIDHYHFNSKLAAGVFNKYIDIIQSSIIPISHSGICDNRSINKIENNVLKIGFIGSLNLYKGFPMIRKAFIELFNDGVVNWQLLVWGCSELGSDVECKNILYKGRYKSDELQYVYNSFNLLVLPALWKETFSFITLESLSFGVPVLVSENVGAKDIVEQFDSEFIIAADKEIIKEKIKNILSNPSKQLSNYNNNLMHGEFNYLLNNHVKDIDNMYKKIIQ